MIHKRWITPAFVALLLTMFCGPANAKTVNLGIVPFAITPESSRSYMEPALLDLFASRLAMKNNVRVIDQAAMTEAYKTNAKDPLERLIAAGKKTQADYVLSGTLDESEKTMTLSAYVLDINTGKAVVSVSVKNTPADLKSDIIPLVNQAAAQINSKLFSRKVPETETPAPSVTPVDIHSHPDKLIKTIPGKKD
jgi:TolB-like protein